jgi:hypothetical protein
MPPAPSAQAKIVNSIIENQVVIHEAVASRALSTLPVAPVPLPDGRRNSAAENLSKGS